MLNVDFFARFDSPVAAKPQESTMSRKNIPNILQIFPKEKEGNIDYTGMAGSMCTLKKPLQISKIFKERSKNGHRPQAKGQMKCFCVKLSLKG